MPWIPSFLDSNKPIALDINILLQHKNYNNICIQQL